MNDVLKSRLVGRADWSPAGDASIGEDDVEFPEILGQGSEEPLAIFRNSNVSAVAMRARSEFGDRLIQRLRIATGDSNLRAFGNKKTGCGQEGGRSSTSRWRQRATWRNSGLGGSPAGLPWGGTSRMSREAHVRICHLGPAARETT